MSLKTLPVFHTVAPDVAGVVSWVHIGDLHMTSEGEQNDLDLRAIVDRINTVFKDEISFVFLPGDVAEKGNASSYAIVHKSLDKLRAPCCAIIGDHDVHEKSFDNFLGSMWPEKHYAFESPQVRFIAMNAFDVPDPRSFAVLDEQLQWLEEQLADATARGQSKVLLLHCYPSDLKRGGERLQALIRQHEVKVV
jgi:3',5'-cyclic AMP phosphodiesterase CpdA